MQESLAEITLARLPLVVLNMARAQGDYFQATRGGGHGDYRHPGARADGRARGGELTQLAFHLADTWRNPVMIFGDYYLAHTYQSVDVAAASTSGRCRPRTGRSTAPPAAPARPSWCRRSATSSSATTSATTSPSYYTACAATTAAMVAEGIEPMVDIGFVDDAEVVVVAFGTPGKYVRYRVCADCAPTAPQVGYVRPITLFPFPTDAIAAAADGARGVAVYENNQGQMVDDVRLAVLGRCPGRLHRRAQPRRVGIRHRARSRRRHAPRREIDRGHGGIGMMEASRVDLVIPTDAPPAGRGAARRRLHAGAHRRRRAPPVPRLRRADRDALGARGRSTSSA